MSSKSGKTRKRMQIRKRHKRREKTKKEAVKEAIRLAKAKKEEEE